MMPYKYIYEIKIPCGECICKNGGCDYMGFCDIGKNIWVNSWVSYSVCGICYE